MGPNAPSVDGGLWGLMRMKNDVKVVLSNSSC